MKKRVLFKAAVVVGLLAITCIAYASTSQAEEKQEKPEDAKKDMLNHLNRTTKMGLTESQRETLDELFTAAANACKAYEKQAFMYSDEYQMLAKIIMAEAGGEDLEGKALVANVIINRLVSPDFPDDIPGVLFQDKQFATVSNKSYFSAAPNDECYKAIDMVMDGWDESEGATFFEAESDSTWHRDHLQFLFKHGNHYFYKAKEA